MAIYTIRPKGTLDLIENGMAKMYREDMTTGKRTEIGDYLNALLPNGARSHRVPYSEGKRQYLINLTNEELSAIAAEVKLVDPDTKKLITSADKYNEFDPFMKHLDLVLDVPNSGMILDDQTAWGKYWMEAMRSAQKVFDIDGNSADNPLVSKSQEFKVTSAGHTEQKMDKDIQEGMRAGAIFHAIKDDFERLLAVAGVLDIVVSENPPISMLQTTIFLKITSEKDFKTKGGVRNIEAFIAANDMNNESAAFRAIITQAQAMKVITKQGRDLVFNEITLGTSADKAYQFLSKKENASLKGLLLAEVAEKSASPI